MPIQSSIAASSSFVGSKRSAQTTLVPVRQKIVDDPQTLVVHDECLDHRRVSLASIEHRVTGRGLLCVELEQQNVAVLNDIFLAFVARLAGFLGRHFAAERHEIIVGDGLGADEAALEIGVDDAGCLRRLGALVDGPGARLLRSDGEIGDEVKQFVAGADELVEARLLQAEVGQEFLGFLVGELRDFGFDGRRDRDGSRAPWLAAIFSTARVCSLPVAASASETLQT